MPTTSGPRASHVARKSARPLLPTSQTCIRRGPTKTKETQARTSIRAYERLGSCRRDCPFGSHGRTIHRRGEEPTLIGEPGGDATTSDTLHSPAIAAAAVRRRRRKNAAAAVAVPMLPQAPILVFVWQPRGTITTASSVDNALQTSAAALVATARATVTTRDATHEVLRHATWACEIAHGRGNGCRSRRESVFLVPFWICSRNPH